MLRTLIVLMAIVALGPTRGLAANPSLQSDLALPSPAARTPAQAPEPEGLPDAGATPAPPQATARVESGAAPGDVIVPPSARCATLPAYPSSERASGRSGKVVLRVTLDEKGAAAEWGVSAGMGPPFDELALAAARQCAFTAASRNGVAVPAIIELSVDFNAPAPPARLEGDVVGELGEPLTGASVTAGGLTVLTDEKGRFALELDVPQGGAAYAVASAVDHSELPVRVQLSPGESRTLRFKLRKERIAQTRVTGSRMLPEVPEADTTPQVSRFQISRAEIERTPGALEDISRVVQQLPGVIADPDLLATFFVRGGGPGEVTYYLDGVPLENPFHLGGFASIFNPMLIESADFFSGGVPARYEPALSGVLEVKYATGETTRPRVEADVSMNTAKARVDAPTGVEGLSVLLSARRSYFELYFAGLKAAGVVGSNYVAPDITELMARANYKKGAHRLTATFLQASDGLNFVMKPDEQVLFNFAGGLKLSNQVQLAILQHVIALGGESELSFTAAYTRDRTDVSVTSETLYSRDTRREEWFVRGDLKWVVAAQHRLQLGMTAARRHFEFVGMTEDTRAIAPWSDRPIVDAGNAELDIHPASTTPLLAAYVEDTWRPHERFTVEGGLRVQANLSNAQSTYSMRAGASYLLPTATVLKLSGGMATQFQPNPFLYDATYGNPDLKPERSLQAVAGIEQPLPIEALVRLEAWYKWLDNLVANPDTSAGVDALRSAGEPVYQNVGWGRAKGIDAMVMGRTRRWYYGLALGLIFSERTNPLASLSRTYPSPWDQRFTASGSLSFAPGDRWLASLRASFHTGRPYTPVVGFVPDDAAGRYRPVFGDTNSARYPLFYELSFRVEKQFELKSVQLAWYFELLNFTNARNLFVYVYSNGDWANRVEPEQGAFNHLPIRPFLGIRGEY